MIRETVCLKKRGKKVLILWISVSLFIFAGIQLASNPRSFADNGRGFKLFFAMFGVEREKRSICVSCIAALLAPDSYVVDTACTRRLQLNEDFMESLERLTQHKPRQAALQSVKDDIGRCIAKPPTSDNSTARPSAPTTSQTAHVTANSSAGSKTKVDGSKPSELRDPPCLVVPANLKRELSINFSRPAPEMSVIEKRFHRISIGGVHPGPLFCRPRDSIAVIIPFRDRESHLRYWLHYTLPLLVAQQLEFTVFVVEQESGAIFNKGQLMNTAFLWAAGRFNCFVFHDVDMIPQMVGNLYKCNGILAGGKAVRHLAPFVDRYSYKINRSIGLTVGGALAFTEWQYRAVNGYSNMYWGWGGEDDDMHVRLKSTGLHRHRPARHFGRYKMIPHNRDALNPTNHDRFALLRGARGRMFKDGLTGLRTKVLRVTLRPLFTHLLVRVFNPLPGEAPSGQSVGGSPPLDDTQGSQTNKTGARAVAETNSTHRVTSTTDRGLKKSAAGRSVA